MSGPGLDFSSLPERLDGVLAEPAGARRGRALEALLDEVLPSVEGLRVTDRNLVSHQRDGELDLVLANDGPALPWLPDMLLVECKSSLRPVASRDLTHLLHQLRVRDMRYGLLVAAAGVTGSSARGTSAHHVIGTGRGWGHTVLVLDFDEMRCLRSPEHLVAVLRRKHEQTVGGLSARPLTATAIRDLDPAPRADRGWASFQEAARLARDLVLDELLDEAAALPGATPELAAARAGLALERVRADAEAQRHHDVLDPLWRTVRGGLVELGGACLALHDELAVDDEGRRLVAFDVLERAPQRLGALPGDELWDLLLTHWVGRLGPDASDRRRDASAAAALCLDSVMAIDDVHVDEDDLPPPARAGSLADLPDVAALGRRLIGPDHADAEALAIGLARDPDMLRVVADEAGIGGYAIVTGLSGAGEDGLLAGGPRAAAPLSPDWIVAVDQAACLYVGTVLGVDRATRTAAKAAMRAQLAEALAANERLSQVYARTLTQHGRALAQRMGMTPVDGVDDLRRAGRVALLRRLGAAA